MAFLISGAHGLEVGLAINRLRHDFDERDRAVMGLLQPHLAQAYQNSLAFTAAQAQAQVLSESLEATGQALVVLTPDDRVAWVTPRGVQLLEQYFPGAMKQPSHLPEPLSRWLRQQQAGFASGRLLAQSRQPFIVSLPDSRLLIRLAGDRPGGHRLLLTEERTSPAPSALKSLGLTQREAEVLHWMGEGKTNPEIGIILSVSPRTIQKHVEHILAKIGVENRTAAVRAALDVE
jgi:DNA-binding CsgD family transcriptional regulator